MIETKRFNSISLNIDTAGNIYVDITIPRSIANIKINKSKLKLVINSERKTIRYITDSTYRESYYKKYNLKKDEYRRSSENDYPLFAENNCDSLYNLFQSVDKSRDVENINKWFYYNSTNFKKGKYKHNRNFKLKNKYNKFGQLDCSIIKFGNIIYQYKYYYVDNRESKISYMILKKINLKTKENNIIFESNVKYDKLGRLFEIDQCNKMKQFHYFSNAEFTFNLVSGVCYCDRKRIVENSSYKYDNRGNIVEIYENGDLLIRYSYDSGYRLIREDNRPLNKTITIEYNEEGNVILKKEYGFSLSKDLNENIPIILYPYSYKSLDCSNQLVSYNGEYFAYDEFGNPVKYRGETLSWSQTKRLERLGDCNYTYNLDGVRTSKTINGIKTKFYLNGDKIIAQEDGYKLIFHYGVDGIVGFTLQLSDLLVRDYTYKKNILGDIIGIYDSNNILICKYIYDAWGNHSCFILSKDGNYIDISTTSDYKNICKDYIQIADNNPFRYRGYYFDTETGLYYYNRKYYDPEIGRLINPDATETVDTRNLNKPNCYYPSKDNHMKK